MLGLFGSLSLAARSMSVQQQASEVTGHNLANANNPAYARQRLVTSTAPTLDTPIGSEGDGVQAVGIQQIRDSFLDTQITANTSNTASLSAQQGALQNAEAYLGEQIQNATGASASSSTGISSALTNFFGAVQTLTTDSSSVSKTNLVTSAQELTDRFNQVSSQLNTVRTGLNNSITDDVSSANDDLNAIASLNDQIMNAKATGDSPNDLIDLRQQKLEDLAGKINFTATAQTDGSVKIDIGGANFVSGKNATNQLQTYDAGGGQLLIQAQTAGTQLTLTGGSIQGKITARDGALASLQNGVNTLASQLITQVNTIYSAGYDSHGNTGANLFTGTDATNIAVNPTLVSDISTLQSRGVPGASGDTSVLSSIATLSHTTIAGLNNQTFTQSFSQTVSNFGTSISTATDQLANSQTVDQMLSNQRSSVSGVNIDEEMTNLLEYQKAYSASAELISTINSMLETVLAMKTS